MKLEQVPIYHVDLTLTDNCDFACRYCFERGDFNTHKFYNPDLFIKRMNELLESNFFKSNYKILNIGFWGGEPTLEPDLINTVVKKYSSDDRVKFFIYSNGYSIDKILDLLLAHKDKYLNGHPKFCIQMSYDGMPIHDIYRTLRGGRLTSSLVRSNILRLDSLGIPSTIKSTVTPETLKYLPSAYDDIRDIWHNGEHLKIFRSSRFFPTIDYHNLEKHTESELEVAKKELEEALVKIAQKEIEYFKKYNQFFFAWFNHNKALCSAGRDMVAIDWDGTIYKCHGCLYDDEEKNDHIVSNLDSDHCIDKLEASNKLHCHNFGFLPTDCENCNAPFCLKCNAVKYSRSNKDQYLDRWRDYSVQSKLCDFFHINEKVFMAVNQIIKEN